MSFNKSDDFCPGYVGVACVNGCCPIALKDEYAERGIPLVNRCTDCPSYKGCEDCALFDTECCDLVNNHEKNRNE